MRFRIDRIKLLSLRTIDLERKLEHWSVASSLDLSKNRYVAMSAALCSNYSSRLAVPCLTNCYRVINSFTQVHLLFTSENPLNLIVPTRFGKVVTIQERGNTI